ncbi:MAG: hypothetical protein WBC26_04715 [Alphaproteobacteria bacterium]
MAVIGYFVIKRHPKKHSALCQALAFPEFKRVCEELDCGSKCVFKCIKRTATHFDLFIEGCFLLLQFPDLGFVSLNQNRIVRLHHAIKELPDLAINQQHLLFDRLCLSIGLFLPVLPKPIKNIQSQIKQLGRRLEAADNF